MYQTLVEKKSSEIRWCAISTIFADPVHRAVTCSYTQDIIIHAIYRRGIRRAA